MKKQKGFTLIELLVVVAVIAILASVVLVNLRGARTSATDSKVISAMGQLRNSAEMVFSEDTKYDSICDATNHVLVENIEDIKTLKDEIMENNGKQSPTCYAEGSNYCVSAQLRGGGYWCIDGEGNSVQTAEDDCTLVTATCTIPTP